MSFVEDALKTPCDKCGGVGDVVTVNSRLPCAACAGTGKALPPMTKALADICWQWIGTAIGSSDPSDPVAVLREVIALRTQLLDAVTEREKLKDELSRVRVAIAELTAIRLECK